MPEESTTPREKRMKRFLSGAALGIPAALGIRGAGDIAQVGAGHIQNAMRPPPFSPEEFGQPWLKHPRVRAFSTASDVLSEMKRKKVSPSIIIGPGSRTPFNVKNGKWTPEHIMLSTPSAPVAMHEIGHVSKPMLGEAWRKLVFSTQSKPGMHPSDMSGVDMIRAGVLLGALHEPGEGKVSRFIHEHAPTLAGLTYLPELAEEARATGSAIRGAYKLHSMAGVKEVLRDLGPAYLGYLAPAVATMAGIAAARGIAGRVRAKMDQRKTAAELPHEPKMQGQLRLSTVQANMAPVGQVKPKTTPPHPGNREGNFAGIAAAKPPSLTKYYRDFTQSLVPGRGERT